jgi:phosphoglucosamine mutase
MARQLFGTDGIRGVAGMAPLDAATVSAFGSALGSDLRKHHSGAGNPMVLIGMDTRESGQWIAETVAGGLKEHSVDVRFAGVITTPGVAWLTRTGHFAAGVMISASHNPYEDNGIKVFAHTGYKLPDDEELEIETEIFRVLPQHPREPLHLKPDATLAPQYCDYLLSTLPVRLDGLHMVIDCGNGAASLLAPELFRKAGARVTAIHNEPNGRNINLQCGALHVESLSAEVVAEHADAGVAFDGDADRAIMVAADGSIVNGDAELLILARALKLQGALDGDMLVATVMSNLGLQLALERDGVRMLRTPVGDKYVLEEMLRTGASLGGEQSGHVIFLKHATTGDGMLTALQVLGAARQQGSTAAALIADLEIYPQKLVNIRVRQRRKIEEMQDVQTEIRAAETAMNGAGRVLVRFSGTEPLVRVMVEGRDAHLVDHYSKSIAKVLEMELA